MDYKDLADVLGITIDKNSTSFDCKMRYYMQACGYSFDKATQLTYKDLLQDKIQSKEEEIMKVYVVEEITEGDGQVDTRYEVFNSLNKAKKCVEDWKFENKHFIEDIQRDIDNGNLDSRIEDEEMYYYAYDSFNFEALTISIEEKEIR